MLSLDYKHLNILNCLSNFPCYVQSCLFIFFNSCKSLFKLFYLHIVFTRSLQMLNIQGHAKILNYIPCYIHLVRIYRYSTNLPRNYGYCYRRHISHVDKICYKSILFQKFVESRFIKHKRTYKSSYESWNPLLDFKDHFRLSLLKIVFLQTGHKAELTKLRELSFHFKYLILW